MVCGFSDPWDPLVMDFNIPDYFNNYMRNSGNNFENIIVANRVWGWARARPRARPRAPHPIRPPRPFFENLFEPCRIKLSRHNRRVRRGVLHCALRTVERGPRCVPGTKNCQVPARQCKREGRDSAINQNAVRESEIRIADRVVFERSSNPGSPVKSRHLSLYTWTVSDASRQP